MLESKLRYLQIAFNGDVGQVRNVLPRIPRSDRILIEAGTPFIKREGMAGVRTISSMWGGKVVADLKTADGAEDEVMIARSAGATAATVLGDAPTETIDIFIKKCSELGMDSMIDMLGVGDPLRVLMDLKKPPSVVVLHKGRDEETSRGKMIKYVHVKRVKSKFDVLISAAGGVDLKGARSAIFNGASIVVVNLVGRDDPWAGMRDDEDVSTIARKFLETIE
ncbi:MAG: hypothetical protein Q7T16_02920 [Candidatus Burarchaeum sp.]|nr:orotidine 5'-phosphate decarboxylase / HUMPS family protein [Candidatus Burarchaeum sp.]MDO8339587.1 hypothetical protein [Candidatus Burarchaeum sp.]